MGSDMKSLAVLSIAFEVCDKEPRLILGRAICDSRGLLVKIAQKRRGHQVARFALEALPPCSTELENAYAQLLSARDTLANTRYGRSVVKFCDREPALFNED